ncbi:hypothetical protein NEOLEDRAFT_1181844 [Neolentinus lepideus HHB14362 ss-1]|uniref:Uncharacterized protein n=1 Tax=Neolentinus lepideus HHB14362 ss-1 TaxID=1314782 RepID=A0A165PLV4_9AGAM|nr:hypothetical protein NEOLEDRAFT_1181844 [Neolentinus lepideus HHB14362 ss-1]
MNEVVDEVLSDVLMSSTFPPDTGKGTLDEYESRLLLGSDVLEFSNLSGDDMADGISGEDRGELEVNGGGAGLESAVEEMDEEVGVTVEGMGGSGRAILWRLVDACIQRREGMLESE